MDRPDNKNSVGNGWIAAIVVAVIVLLLGVFMYLRLSLPMEKKTAPAATSADISVICEKGKTNG